MPPQKFLIILAGPTASGKTTTAIALAQHYQCEILSADSRQFYREMNIGTAKPTAEELAAAPHHFINSINIQETYSVGDYMRDALNLLDRLFETQSIVCMTGGSGLFIRAVCEGLDEFPEVPIEIRKTLELQLKEEGLETLQEELKLRDPDYYKKVDKDNPQRLIRALSICRVSEKPYSTFLTGQKAERPFIPIYLSLQPNRELLYQRINQRVDQMMEDGLLEEIKGLYPFKTLNSLQTVGYQELFSFLDQQHSLEEGIELIKRNSRRYAKRQLTWLRKNDHWKAFEVPEIAKMIAYIDLTMTEEH